MKPVYWSYHDGQTKVPLISRIVLKNRFDYIQRMKKKIPEKSIAFTILHAYVIEETLLHSCLDLRYIEDCHYWDYKANKSSDSWMKRKRKNCVFIG
jgi:hypothetical protein